jgi:tetratricopeptide (TPR) repeat protein
MRIGPPNLAPAVADDATALLAEIPAGPEVGSLLRLCDGSRRVGEVVETSPAPVEESWRTIYGLVLAGILEPEPQRAAGVVHKDQVTRDEVLARLERVEGADHYAVLEMMPTATGDEIRSAYYFLARRYHPDRFRTGPLADLLAGMERYFSQVTEAYNTLIDPVLRRSYDEQRGEVGRPKRVEQNTRELARQNYVYARSLIEKGRYTDAVTSLENALQLDASVASYHLELGRLLARNPRRRDEARGHLERANAIDPALVDGYLALGELELRAGRTAEAITLFNEVLRWEPGHLEATRRLEEAGESPGSGGGLRGLFGGG